MTSMTKDELINAAYNVTGGSLADLNVDQIHRLMTVTQYVTDLCLNELESRDALTFRGGMLIMPYHSEHGVQTILTRP